MQPSPKPKEIPKAILDALVAIEKKVVEPLRKLFEQPGSPGVAGQVLVLADDVPDQFLPFAADVVMKLPRERQREALAIIGRKTFLAEFYSRRIEKAASDWFFNRLPFNLPLSPAGLAEQQKHAFSPGDVLAWVITPKRAKTVGPEVVQAAFVLMDLFTCTGLITSRLWSLSSLPRSSRLS